MRRSVWAAFDWAVDVDLEVALRQQRELTEIVNAEQAALETGVLERVADDWSLATQRHARQVHQGLVGLSKTHCFLGRSSSLPAS